MDAQFLIVRSDDLVILGVRWSGFRLAPNALAREAQSDEAQGVLTIPPQAITEEVVVLRNFLPRQARLVGPSQIEFAVRPGTRMRAFRRGGTRRADGERAPYANI